MAICQCRAHFRSPSMCSLRDNPFCDPSEHVDCELFLFKSLVDEDFAKYIMDASDYDPKNAKRNADYVTRMQEISEESKQDPESAHVKADDLLCEILTDLGYGDVVNIFNNMERWYS